jgi:L,D-transpeptidase YcbB
MIRMHFIYKRIPALLVTIFFLCINSMSSAQSPGLAHSDEGISSLIKKTITEWKMGSEKTPGEQISSAVLVRSFYKGRNFLPAWSEDGHLTQVDSLIKAIEDAYGDGLSPDYYHLTLIKSLADQVGKAQIPDPAQLSDLDILLTDAFLTLGCHLSAGCVNPVTLETKWFAKSMKVDVSSVLEQALKKKEIREALTELRPQKGIYNRLKTALARYRELALKGDWPPVSTGPSLKKGMKSDRVVQLRKRLKASGDLTLDEAAGDLYDDKLELAVVEFQNCHGLKADGAVGRDTLIALNVPLSRRIRQMELNMERLRWILGSQEERFIVVNIADFRLDVIENDKSILSMKVVVGKPYMSTPIFTAKMIQIVINPPWNIPPKIARNEVLRDVQKNPRYLEEQHIEVLQGPGYNSPAIDPGKIDWSQVTAKDLTYRFRQMPGKWNALGTLKFLFPNEYDVYLHDTPAKSLFAADMRAFSHGCTRIEKPLDLAEYLLRDDPQWSRKEIEAAIEKGDGQVVRIPRPLNVHFLYLTAWVDEDNVVQFRNDIYGRDASLDKALRRRPSFQ